MNKHNSKREVHWEKVEAVQRMQDYIKEHVLDEFLDMEDMYIHVGYSKRHANRILKELLNMTPQEYIKAIRLSNSAIDLVNDTKKSVLEIALDTNFGTHEGYARAFKDEFGISPNAYRKEPIRTIASAEMGAKQALPIRRK